MSAVERMTSSPLPTRSSSPSTASATRSTRCRSWASWPTRSSRSSMRSAASGATSCSRVDGPVEVVEHQVGRRRAPRRRRRGSTAAPPAPDGCARPTGRPPDRGARQRRPRRPPTTERAVGGDEDPHGEDAEHERGDDGEAGRRREASHAPRQVPSVAVTAGYGNPHGQAGRGRQEGRGQEEGRASQGRTDQEGRVQASHGNHEGHGNQGDRRGRRQRTVGRPPAARDRARPVVLRRARRAPRSPPS